MTNCMTPKASNNVMYNPCRIIDIVDEAKDVKTFLLESSLNAKPGQFVKVWIPGVNEKPFSVSSSNGITVKKFGEFTTKLFESQEGDTMMIRGPYGNSFLDFAGNGEKYIVAGGIGAAPLVFLSEQLKATVLLGAKTKDEIAFEKRFRERCNVMISTDDGTYGKGGFVIGLLDDINIEKDSQFFICGPEKMVMFAAKKALNYTKAENIILSLERYMKCSVGLCGSCEFNGYRVCIDGPVFSYDKVLHSELGESKRDKSGNMVKL